MDTKEYVSFLVKDFLQRKGLVRYGVLKQDCITEDVLEEMAQEFLELVPVGDTYFNGIGGWLQWVFGCLLQKWFKESKKYPFENLNDIPELVTMSNDIEEFERFTKKYLGFEQINGGFKFMKDNK